MIRLIDNITALLNFLVLLIPFIKTPPFIVKFVSSSLYFVSACFCFCLVISSTVHISRNFTIILLLLFILIFPALILNKIGNKNLLAFSFLKSIVTILAFIQTFIWVVDSGNSLHEPRSVILAAIATVLYYYGTREKEGQEEISNFLALFVFVILSFFLFLTMIIHLILKPFRRL
jgi:hypothetical protein